MIPQRPGQRTPGLQGLPQPPGGAAVLLWEFQQSFPRCPARPNLLSPHPKPRPWVLSRVSGLMVGSFQAGAVPSFESAHFPLFLEGKPGMERFKNVPTLMGPKRGSDLHPQAHARCGPNAIKTSPLRHKDPHVCHTTFIFILLSNNQTNNEMGEGRT